MEEQRFDDLARLVAAKTSRRQVLKVLAGAAVGGLFAGRLSPAWASSTRSQCAQFCNAAFGEDTPAASQCLKDGKNNPNALCNSACNGGGGTLCGGPSYSTTTCCSGSTPSCTNGTCVAACISPLQTPCTPGTDVCCDTGQGVTTCSTNDFNSSATFCCNGAGGTCSSDSDCCSRDYFYVCSNGTCVQGCFTGETLISMADGTSRRIEQVAVGDLVLGDGGVVNGVLHVHTPVLGNRSLYGFNGGSAFVTSGHPFMTEEGWKSIDPTATASTNPDLPVDRLTLGDRLLSLTGVAVPVGGMPTSGETVEARIEPVSVQRLEGQSADAETQLYNLRLDGNQTYFANGLLVHNK